MASLELSVSQMQQSRTFSLVSVNARAPELCMHCAAYSSWDLKGGFVRGAESTLLMLPVRTESVASYW